MFKNEFQGGSHIEVFTAQGSDPLSRWKLTGSVTREYHKDVRGYAVTMEGRSSTINTQMKLPKAEKSSLGLTQSFLVFQLLVPDGSRLAVELSVLDKSGNHRRIQLSSSVKDVSVTPPNARVPLTSLFTGQWINLCIDVGSFVSGLFKGQVFKSLEGISLGGSCMLRRIFTLKSPPPDTTGETDCNTDVSTLDEIPRACQMPSGVATIHTQVIGYGREVSSSANIQVPQKPLVSGTRVPALTATTNANDERPMHIAFGKKVAIPDHILNSRPSGRQSIADPLLSVGGEEIGPADSQRLQPRPPSKPADPRVLKIQKKRVRIISSGKQASRQAAEDNATLQQSSGNDKEIDIDSGNRLNISTGTRASVIDSGSKKFQGVKIHSSVYDQTIDQGKSNIQIATSVLATDNASVLSADRISVQGNGLARDEQLAIDVLQYKGTSEATNQLLLPDKHDKEMISYTGLSEVGNAKKNTEELLDTTSNSKELDTSGVRNSQLERSLDEVLYSYRSLPKSAERQLADITDSLTMDVTGRSAGHDEDFIPSFSMNKQGSPHEQHKVDETSEDKEARLSDDYDWWQYASVEDTDITQSEPSLRTRLTNAGPSQKTLSASPLRHSSKMERTLSGSVTLSGWTEKFNDATRSPLHDSLDTREMGGMLSPLMGTLTDGPTFLPDPVDSSREGEELELLYDPQLNCFYDPVTFKYYELAP